MEFLVNDLSLEDQSPDIPTFREAIERLIGMRNIIHRFECELYCHKNIANVRVTGDLVFSEMVQKLTWDQEQAVMQWISRNGGPFWDDTRVHNPDEYLECCNGKVVVTDSAIREAACRLLSGESDYHLVSLISPLWAFTPISVTWIPDNDRPQTVDVANYWMEEPLEAMLQKAPPRITSWEELARHSEMRFSNLRFFRECFDPLPGYPLGERDFRQILKRFQVLDELKSGFGTDGQRTPKGQEIYQKYFTGEKAWFSDSSNTEKHKFRKDLHFSDPTKIGNQSLFCPWHGKIKGTLQLRIHFSWPVRADEPLYVVYVGPKITKR
uniref:Uncharacterized protein n=1 Tax=Candidatus Kentrum sp. TUN TaxID=2126343 RepID=A0A450ZC46_9GAMM|nr:MAG: hypothetical protein BECKTUN1418D_GA0071000_100728 [Candidatus Kentron sp. TUN]